MKQGTIDLLNSERGTFCVMLLVASIILVLVGKLTSPWVTFALTLAGILVTSKTITQAPTAVPQADS